MSLEFSAMRLSACRRAPWLRLGFVLVVTAALAGPHGAAAQTGNSPSSTASEPTATTTPVGPARKAGSEPGSTEDCPPLQPASFEGITSAVVIELDPSTLWRPRGSEVRVIVSGSPQLSVLALRACFGWSADDRASPGFQAGSEIWKQRSSPLVLSVSSAAGKIEYGVAVPDMPQIQGAWPLRALGHSPHRFTGLFTVPVADMQVIATVRGPDGKDMQLSIVLPVGITSASSAVVLVMAMRLPDRAMT